MSGTPSISEVYAVLGSQYGGPQRRFDLRVSLVVLTRGPWLFRPQVLTEYHAMGFFEILCLENSRPRYDTANLLRTLPGLRFLVDQNASNPGALINRAAREVRGERFLVVWDDQALPEQGLYTRVQRLWQDSAAVAVAPQLLDTQGRELPSVMIPVLDRDRLKILALAAEEDCVDTLFPSDYTALYDRQRFLHTGGYDAGAGAFWQKADWGLRSRLWGETLSLEKGFKMEYRRAPPTEDQTPDVSYPRFFLRNLAIRYAGDHGVLPLSRFWSHARRCGLSLLRALGEFLKQREWVRLHRYRFQADARLLTELWGRS